MGAATSSSWPRAAWSTLAALTATPPLSCPTPSQTRFLPRLSCGPSHPTTSLVCTCCPRSLTRRSPLPTSSTWECVRPSCRRTKLVILAFPRMVPSNLITTDTRLNFFYQPLPLLLCFYSRKTSILNLHTHLGVSSSGSFNSQFSICLICHCKLNSSFIFTSVHRFIC